MFRFELDAGFVEHKIYNIKLPKFKILKRSDNVNHFLI